MNSYPLLKEVVVIKPYTLELYYENKEKRLYDFTPNLNHNFYEPLKNEGLFSQVKVESGQLLWPTGQDFCPNTLYEHSSLL